MSKELRSWVMSCNCWACESSIRSITQAIWSPSVIILKFWVSWFVFFRVFYKYFKKRSDFSMSKPAAVFCDQWTAWWIVQVSNLVNLLLLVLYLSLPLFLLKPSKLIGPFMFHLSINFLFSRWFWSKFSSTQKVGKRRELSLLCSDVHWW